MLHPARPRTAIEVLRATLADLEKMQDLSAEDPALVELKRHILRTIAELEVARIERSAA